MTDQNYTIREAVASDSKEIAKIYNHYITGTIITFEEDVVSADIIAGRIREVHLARLPWLVVEQRGRLLGYAYAAGWKERSAYRFSTEVTVYLDNDHLGKGIGSQLYNHLIPALKEKGIHAALGVITLPNDASVGLHEKLGFEKAAHFKEVGYKFNKWIDVGYWQLIL